jgi:TrpR-related protein YerC/YecD
MTAAPSPTRDPVALQAALRQALMSPTTEEEMGRLLADLCTPAEIRTLAERWHVAQLLEAGALTYREIHDATGVSTTTIVRVARFLKQEPHQGYRLALDRTGAADVRR